MRNLSDTIIESLLTKTKEKVSAAKGATLRVDADYRREMVGQVWDTLTFLDRIKFYKYLEKDKKPTKPETDMFGKDIHIGDLVVFDWDANFRPWFGVVFGPSDRKRPNEYDVMEFRCIYSYRPFDDCSRYVMANEMAVICEYTDIEKTLKILKKQCSK